MGFSLPEDRIPPSQRPTIPAPGYAQGLAADMLYVPEFQGPRPPAPSKALARLSLVRVRR